MQLSTEWSRLSGFHLVNHRTASAFANLGERMTRIRVFKKPGDFITLTAVTTTYWLASATISSPILFPLVHGIYKVEMLRIALALLSVIGLFVLFNEPVRAFIAGHTPAIKVAVSALAALLGAAAVCYWVDGRIFGAVFNAATYRPLDSVAFAAGNLVLLSANIILPALGGGFVLRVAQQILRPSAGVR
jgi:hypothetical protein